MVGGEGTGGHVSEESCYWENSLKVIESEYCSHWVGSKKNAFYLWRFQM